MKRNPMTPEQRSRAAKKASITRHLGSLWDVEVSSDEDTWVERVRASTAKDAMVNVEDQYSAEGVQVTTYSAKKVKTHEGKPVPKGPQHYRRAHRNPSRDAEIQILVYNYGPSGKALNKEGDYAGAYYPTSLADAVEIMREEARDNGPFYYDSLDAFYIFCEKKDVAPHSIPAGKYGDLAECVATQRVYFLSGFSIGEIEEINEALGIGAPPKRNPRSNPVRRNTAAPMGKGPRIRISYDIFTEESVEEGGAAESGWVDDEGESMRPDKYDQSEGITVVDMAVKFLRDAGVVEASSSAFHKGIWYIGADDTDFRTGDVETRHYHLVDFSQAQEREVFERLFPRRARRNSHCR